MEVKIPVLILLNIINFKSKIATNKITILPSEKGQNSGSKAVIRTDDGKFANEEEFLLVPTEKQKNK